MIKKIAIVITGPESSGSMFISRVVAYVMNLDKVYENWHGSGMLGNIGDDLVILHRSTPWGRPKVFFQLEEYEKLFKDYHIKYIVCSRDQNISFRSKAIRFDRNSKEIHDDLKNVKQTLDKILDKEAVFIWNYETMILLGPSYFKMLYKFIDAKKIFIPSNIIDGNKKWIKDNSTSNFYFKKMYYLNKLSNIFIYFGKFILLQFLSKDSNAYKFIKKIFIKKIS